MGTWHTIRWRTIAVGAELARPRCNNPESITGSGGLRFAQRIHCGNCRVACQAWFIRVQQGGVIQISPYEAMLQVPRRDRACSAQCTFRRAGLFRVQFRLRYMGRQKRRHREEVSAAPLHIWVRWLESFAGWSGRHVSWSG